MIVLIRCMLYLSTGHSYKSDRGIIMCVNITYLSCDIHCLHGAANSIQVPLSIIYIILSIFQWLRVDSSKGANGLGWEECICRLLSWGCGTKLTQPHKSVQKHTNPIADIYDWMNSTITQKITNEKNLSISKNIFLMIPMYVLVSNLQDFQSGLLNKVIYLSINLFWPKFWFHPRDFDFRVTILKFKKYSPRGHIQFAIENNHTSSIVVFFKPNLNYRDIIFFYERRLP